MASKYLAGLSKEEYDKLTDKLLEIQNSQCFICQKKIDKELQETNIDHITPLVGGGKDDEKNFAVTHESCNKSKQDSNLEIARIMQHLREIQDNIPKEENRSASLKDVLSKYNGSKFEFKSKKEGDILKYSFSELDNSLFETKIYQDPLSSESFCFMEVPVEYLFHDDFINPRGINDSILKLIKEFYKGNPQLHLSLGRIDEDKIKIFDGQHKAVAQILLGTKKLMLRVFINPEVDRLLETNRNAGSTLRQIAFDKSIMRQLNNVLYNERIRRYQEDHKLPEDDLSFSESDLVDYFKGERVNIKKYIIDAIKNSITYNSENKLKDFIDIGGGRAKDLPISHSTYDKTFLSVFVDSKLVLDTPISFKDEEGRNPRELEIAQLTKLMDIIAEEIYVGKFIPEIGVYRIENRIVAKKDKDIPDNHLIAYRLSKEEVMYNWLGYIKDIVKQYFFNNGMRVEENKLFQYPFTEQLWKNIRNFVINLKDLPLWKDRSMASTAFSGKYPYDYWKNIFNTGKTPEGAQVLSQPINFIDMIQRGKDNGN
jgi:hypothetical protein